MKRKSMPKPVREISKTGLLPNRSDKSPRTGPAKKLINPPATAKVTFHSAAMAVSPPENCFRRFGRIGTMMPMDIALATALTKMKPKAARLRPAAGTGNSSRTAGSSDMRRRITPGGVHLAYLRAQCKRLPLRRKQACSLGDLRQSACAPRTEENSMKAIRFEQVGGPEVLQFVDVDLPAPG